MAMDNFSYKDSIRAAFTSCMPCMRRRAPIEPNPNTSSDSRAHRSPSSELEGLLRDTDTEAETLSLHSNIGARRRKQRKRPAFSLTLFGYTLFGRQPIYLSDDEDERGSRRRTLGTASSSTLDSDAAPLDASTIARLSSPDRVEAEHQRWEEEARQKAERKARRRERRERERMSTLMSLNGGSLPEGGEFEGFQCSGESSLPQLPAAGFGPFVDGPEEMFTTDDAGEDSGDADEADLGGGLYTRKQRTHTIRSGSGSDSRSQLSIPISNGEPSIHYHHHHLSQAVPPSYPQTEMRLPKPAKAKKDRTRKRLSPLSSSTSQSTTPYTPAQSVSASPAVAAFPIPHERIEHVIEGRDARGFPSVGLSGARGKTRDMGAFLASREAAQP